MPFLGIVFICLSSFLTGSLITAVFRERKSDFAVKFATGFLSLFALLLIAVLCALKLDWKIEKLSLVYVGVLSAISCISGLTMLKNGITKPGIFFDRKNLGFYVFAALTALVSFIVFSQSLINDDTLEIVNTTVATGSIYKYSSLTGAEMINGLPIYNKVYVMPMFYSVMCKTFGLNPIWMMMTIIPVIIYVINMTLVSKIAREINISNRNAFMSAYLLLLISSTYLPSFGIPVTGGYAILRQGYSGYAVLYGVALPLILLALIKKKHLKALGLIVLCPELVRIDRLFYAVKESAGSYTAINSAGKIMAVFFIALVVAFVLVLSGRGKVNFRLVFAPILFITTIAVTVFEIVKNKKEKTIAVVSFSVIALASVAFEPYKGAETMPGFISNRNEVSECLSALWEESSNLKIYSDTDFMSYVRICKGNVEVLYGRDYDCSYMLGLDYEKKPEFISDYDRDMKNQLSDFDYLVTEHTRQEIIGSLASDGVNTVVFPADYNIDRVIFDYTYNGFAFKGKYGKFNVYSRN